ncbi:helix-turn-helix domain-containing protein [Nitriliruptor alkaliphilus]|uniref:helix-turn-helix domain-containing protein n=1 Tax=Nitriliruptor alkaliphilus TaxID=427918 RepID=UPI0009F844CC|nr:helix-turn-helix domain-containing protein [Nitriliruptor alkaliphilus]
MDDAATSDQGIETLRAGNLRDWTSVIRDQFVALNVAPSNSSELVGAVRSRQLAHLGVAEVESTPQMFERTSRLVSRSAANVLQIGLVSRGAGHLVQDGRTCSLGPGDFAIYESSRPFTWTLTGDWRLLVYTWPREMVPLLGCDSQRLTARLLGAESGVARILSPMLTGLMQLESGLSPTISARLADECAELTITAAWEAAGLADADATSVEHFWMVRKYIEERLQDTDLNPQTIADAFCISTRTLHRIFAKQGTTVASWIRSRRLEACRQAMTSPGSRMRSLTEIALGYGFTDSAAFSRAFKCQYGVSPSRYRSQLH